MLKQCPSQPASLLSPIKEHEDFRSQGYELSKDPLHRYLHYLQESNVVFPQSVAEGSVHERAMNPRKLHPVDWALGYPLVPASARGMVERSGDSADRRLTRIAVTLRVLQFMQDTTPCLTARPLIQELGKTTAQDRRAIARALRTLRGALG